MWKHHACGASTSHNPPPPDFIRLSCPLFGPRKSPPRVSGFFRSRIPAGTHRVEKEEQEEEEEVVGSGSHFMTMFVCSFPFRFFFFLPFGAQSIFIAQLAYAGGKWGECRNARAFLWLLLFWQPFFFVFFLKSHAKELWRTINQSLWRREVEIMSFLSLISSLLAWLKVFYSFLIMSEHA